MWSEIGLWLTVILNSVICTVEGIFISGEQVYTTSKLWAATKFYLSMYPSIKADLLISVLIFISLHCAINRNSIKKYLYSQSSCCMKNTKDSLSNRTQTQLFQWNASLSICLFPAISINVNFKGFYKTPFWVWLHLANFRVFSMGDFKLLLKYCVCKISTAGKQ